MSLETAVTAHLLAQPGLTALIGNRLYPMVIPQTATLPAVTYQRISSVRHSAMVADTGVATVRLSFNCWAAAYPQAKAVAKELRAALQRCADTIGSGANTVSGVASFVVAEYDDYEPDTGRYRVMLDFEISHQE